MPTSSRVRAATVVACLTVSGESDVTARAAKMGMLDRHGLNARGAPR
jgi:hypothetical protein